MEMHQFIASHARTIRQVEAGTLLIAAAFLVGAFQRGRTRFARFLKSELGVTE